MKLDEFEIIRDIQFCSRISLFLILALKYLITVLSVSYRVVISQLFIASDVVIRLITRLALIS